MRIFPADCGRYGALLDGAGAGIANRLAAFEAEQDRAASAGAGDG